ncbi:helix-turn-helix domain-containing protein [Holdemanella biformis]|uniref:helix-turn-helix domain-containing protein n=1 Tax=Holdemanella biformis TaxID=1735 RepID=UPI0022E88F7C|nr:helix-turn-helix transcriptional regulator [Holdemanella biformis]
MDISTFDSYDTVEACDVIKTLRKEKKITQKELAKKLNITQSAVSQFESGQTKLTEQQIKSILSALDVDYSDFYLFYSQLLHTRTSNKALERYKKETESLPGKIMTTTNQLNEQGQRKVFEYVLDLLQIDKYKK